VLDEWYVEQTPFLTHEREAALRAAWAEAVAAREAQASSDELESSGAQCCGGSRSCEASHSGEHSQPCRADALPRCEAYRLAFTPTEQTEISFGDFEEELLDFRAPPTDASEAAPSAGGAEESGVASVDSEVVDLETVLDFLRATQ
jgi:hypothetical protein